MKKKLPILAVIVAVVIGLAVFNHFRPARLTAETLEKAQKVQEKIDQQNKASATPVDTVDAVDKSDRSDGSDGSDKSDGTAAVPATEEAKEPKDPNVLKVKFECSNGTFVLECRRDWAPLGFDRFKELVKTKFYDGARFFRVVPGFVVQFGLAADPEVTKKWRAKRINDDPAKKSNVPGTITFATSGPNTRTSQLFVNLGNNVRLDSMGFTPFGKVVKGMDVVKAITAKHGESPNQGEITARGNAYLEESFPDLDYIKTATIVE